ncbi:hypothetical protein [uncultured Bacteroides sp.]|uniref:hypothetical protein n=1 Tax=uncultured Bacteroides sp. TaxID=162156 RepID=UPI002AAB222F|nr:hypothetical protein [uncultured Bacteroides sp.]
MKKLVFLLLSGIFLSCCSRANMKPEKDSFFILVNLSLSNERNKKDYIKLWVNDSLLFKGPYLVNYMKGDEDAIGDVWGMEVANLSKKKE